VSIIKTGKVTVSEQEVLIEQFHFEHVDMSKAACESLEWAIERCEEQLRKERKP
jgi:hypothetical protein